MMELEISPLQQYIIAHGFHPLTEHEIDVISFTLRQGRNELKVIGIEALIKLGPVYAMDRLILDIVDVFYMVRNVSREW